ncbi:MAG: AAA family ATPase [Bryobacterales bacterium]|nr:AAA family ATPase [Bryobacterales bacterium]
MIISQLVLRNWRNFRTVDVPLTDRVFIVGPNASGKSNLLDSIRFLRDIAKPGGGLQRAITQRGGLSKIRCLAARREPDVEIEVNLTESDTQPVWRYALGITQQVRGYRQPLLRYERVWRGDKQILDRPDKDDRRDELRLTQTHLEQIGANADFREIARFFESIRYLHLVPQLLRHPEAFQGPASEEDPFGRNFLEVVAKTGEKTRKSRLRKIEAALREAVPQLKNLTDTKDESGVPHLEAMYEHWRPNAGRQREDQFSDGTLRLIGLFWSLLDGDSPLLLEEPELSLHAKIVSKLPGLFHRLQRHRKRQIFVSTHSWDMLSEKGIGGEEVLMLTPDPEGTRVELPSNVKEARSLLEAGFSVAEVVLPRTAPEGLVQLDLFR